MGQMTWEEMIQQEIKEMIQQEIKEMIQQEIQTCDETPYCLFLRQ